MPQRSRQQQIEEEARAAFRDAIPSRWVIRPLHKDDYGIDDEVEIFDENGFATGRTFLVQNKGTDEENLSTALAMRLKVSTVGYLRQQDRPVLLVRYHAPSRSLYAQWFHAFDVRPRRRNQKRITYRLSAEDVWQDDRPSELAADVERWRTLRLGELLFPVHINLEILSPVGNLSPGEIEVGLTNAVTDIGDLVTLRPLPGEIQIPVAVDAGVVHINRGSSPSLSLHHSDFSYDNDLGAFIADFFCSLGVWLGMIRKDIVAGELLSRFAPAAAIIHHDPELAFQAAGSYFRARRIDQYIALVETFLASEDSVHKSTGDFLANLLVLAPRLSPLEVSRVRGFLESRAVNAAARSDDRDASVTHYNLGSFLRSQDDYRAAVAAYWSAAAWDPQYFQRDYFCREIASCLFLLEEYEHAAAFYGAAIGLEPDPRTVALLADALTMQGQYEEAREAYVEYAETVEGDHEPEFLLRIPLLNRAIEIAGPNQIRQPERADGLFDDVSDAVTEEDMESRIQAALALDPLSSVTNFNLGVLRNDQGRKEEARDAFLYAALINRGDVEAWTNALFLSYDLENEHNHALDQIPTSSLIFLAAQFANGSRFIDRLREQARDNEGYLRHLATAVLQLPTPTRQRPVLRLLSDGPDYLDVLAHLDEAEDE